MFNDEQQYALEQMKNGQNVFITGPGGCGKSFVIGAFIDYLKFTLGDNYCRFVGKTSTTGSSAYLIGGITIHSFLGLGLGTDSTPILVSKIKSNKKLEFLYKRLLVLIIDEVSMLSASLFDKIDDLLKIIRNNDSPFGGVQVILSGDFAQLPVIGDEKMCFTSPKWNTNIYTTVYLKHIWRQSNPLWVSILNKIRLGIVDDDVKNILKSRIGVNVGDDEIKSTRLYSTRTMVNDTNRLELEKLITTDNQKKIFRASYQFTENVKGKQKNVPPQKHPILKDIANKTTVCDEELVLCIGAQVVMLNNNKSEDGNYLYVNGSRGIITRFIFDGLTEKPVVKILHDDNSYVIEKYTWEIIKGDTTIKKMQFPLKLAWSLTIHKSQGMTLDCVETDAGSSIFEYGQLYVALSRVRDISGLSLISFNPKKIRVHPDVLKYYQDLDEKLIKIN